MFNVCVISESFLDKVSNNCPIEILKTVHISDIFQNIKLAAEQTLIAG